MANNMLEVFGIAMNMLLMVKQKGEPELPSLVQWFKLKGSWIHSQNRKVHLQWTKDSKEMGAFQ
jgi:hypothetical protein